jgi:hypothetical protein
MSDPQYVHLTRDELKSLMTEAVDSAFLRMGLDTTSPLETQRDMQHLRDWRLAVNSVTSKGMLSVVLLIISGLIAATWVGLKMALTSGGPPLQ